MGRVKSLFRRRKVAKPPENMVVEVSGGGGIGGGGIGGGNGGGGGLTSKAVKKKAVGARLWMRFDGRGKSELMECDKSVIIKKVSIPARDLRILGPIFSHSSSILVDFALPINASRIKRIPPMKYAAREKAMLVNLEFIRAIVTAEEVLLLEPLRQEVLPFVEQLKQLLSHKTPTMYHGATHAAGQDAETQSPTSGPWLPAPDAIDSVQDELPFEFQVLEIALEAVCMYLDSNVAELEREAYPVLDELARNVSTKNLEQVRSLKSNLTRLLARVQKVRDEIEHLLDDNEDMAQLYLTRKLIQNQQSEFPLSVSNGIVHATHHLRRLSSARSGSYVSTYTNDLDVEDLEMLLEAYFMQLDGTRNKILSVREYIDDTEDYVNIQLDNQRNELIQLQLTLTIASFAVAVETLIAGIFGMNIPYTWNNTDGIFWHVVGTFTAACVLLFFLILGYARWKKLLGS